eukprot:TRINITY_DN2029_c0_g1_i3.p1 TRINITY_DN2029_c0_g1~~TRINITY_DN2029_c0_g1_i3.p1  ORF type:complete len:381 (-),score=114.59 TRINITY_DN2029_c0_g1_i3:70-1212(-)
MWGCACLLAHSLCAQEPLDPEAFREPAPLPPPANSPPPALGGSKSFYHRKKHTEEDDEIEPVQLPADAPAWCRAFCDSLLAEIESQGEGTTAEGLKRSLRKSERALTALIMKLVEVTREKGAAEEQLASLAPMPKALSTPSPAVIPPLDLSVALRKLNSLHAFSIQGLGAARTKQALLQLKKVRRHAKQVLRLLPAADAPAPAPAQADPAAAAEVSAALAAVADAVCAFTTEREDAAAETRRVWERVGTDLVAIAVEVSRAATALQQPPQLQPLPPAIKVTALAPPTPTEKAPPTALPTAPIARTPPASSTRAIDVNAALSAAEAAALKQRCAELSDTLTAERARAAALERQLSERLGAAVQAQCALETRLATTILAGQV